jgi:hypothetical protein
MREADEDNETYISRLEKANADLFVALKELAAAYPHWANDHPPSATELVRTAEACRVAWTLLAKAAP